MDDHPKELTMTDYVAVPETTEKEAKALALVRSNIGWSAGVGLLPMPGLDIAAIAGVQVNMLRQMANIYGVPFTGNLVKSLVVSLISGGSSVMLGGAAASLVKGLPIVGTVAGMLTMPVLAAASTWATGKVFIRHFESGGTFLDFDPAKARAYYAEQFEAHKAKG
jgi:uncharacterized protein (DUF697 family)